MNQRDRDNNTPLHWACQESHFDIVGVLMSRNAAVDPVNDLQSTPLHYACREVRKPQKDLGSGEAVHTYDELLKWQ